MRLQAHHTPLWGQVYHSNGLSLVLLRRSLRIANFLELRYGEVLRETVRKASSANQTPRHQTAHRYVDERFASLRQPLVVFAHPSVVVYPGERPLHYPPTW